MSGPSDIKNMSKLLKSNSFMVKIQLAKQNSTLHSHQLGHLPSDHEFFGTQSGTNHQYENVSHGASSRFGKLQSERSALSKQRLKFSQMNKVDPGVLQEKLL